VAPVALVTGATWCLALTPPGRTIGVGLHDGTIEIVDLLLVTSLKPRSNGAKRRRRP
jgi:hypothetical protein